MYRINIKSHRNIGQTCSRKLDSSAFSLYEVMDELSVMCAEDEIHITARARSFLYHQIRNITGSLVQVGIGKWSVDDFIRVRDAKDRSQAGPTAPPHGLYLTEIDYQLD